jgi:hypothetical protein
LNRFDDDTKASFLDLYTKCDAGASIEQLLTPELESQSEVTSNLEEEILF